MDTYSADALRLLLLSSPLLSGEDFSLQDKDVADMARKLSMVWNMYDFFTLYADVDGWEWNGKLEDPRLAAAGFVNPMDDWIISRVNQLTTAIQQHMDNYDIPSAVKPVLPFLDDASNWYVRRSRRRFWKSGDDADKNAAYSTLHYVLVRLSLAMAPFTPFLAEELYQKLTGGESVHLCDWPQPDNINELVLQEMSDLRQGIEQVLSQRASAKLKVRQPLSRARLYLTRVPQAKEELEAYMQIAKEELNVKHAEISESKQPDGRETKLDLKLTPGLKREGLAREVIRHVQSARKQAGLNVDDRINLSLSTTDNTLRQAIEEYAETIASETLATELVFDQTFASETSGTVEAAPLTISLESH
jgi:isoleucyl-tRNA synthetase